LLDTAIPAEELPLSLLWKKWQESTARVPNEKEAYTSAVFFRKLVFPWLCLFAVMGSIPFCVRFARDQKMFFVYAFTLFGLVASYLILNAAFVLAKRQVLAPELAIGIPFAVLMGMAFGRFILVR
jgi:lipopolysaccharide export system permease protein